VGPHPAPYRRTGPGAPAWVVVLDVGAKVLLLLALARVALGLAWGNLEGKAPGTRAVTYPMLALVVPLAHLLRRRPGCYPWLADLLVTVPAFSDVLGNRLDLYDRVVWFDDFMHFLGTGSLSAAVVLLVGEGRAPPLRRLVVALSAGMTLALAWEVWEYFAFVARSGEAAWAYADTVGDLALGWLGAATAAVLLGAVRGGADGESWPVASGSDRAGALGTDAVESRDLRP
jgi:hypothetical protein